MTEANRWRLVAAACWLALFGWLFWDVLFLPNSFAFRDTAHFYHPLFKLIGQEWSAGRIPLWNPYENSGQPLLANSTSSVFYPGKLIFVLPIGYAWALKFYLLGHLLLAGATAYVVARRWGADLMGATLCGLSYAFGGHVLFQLYNVVFLCGAAWLPLAILAGDRMLRERRWRHALALGATLAMMILAGDAQLAYEAGWLTALGALLYWRKERGAARKEPVAWQRSRPALLLAAASWTAALAAVQVLPTAELNRLGDRAYFDLPRSLYEIPAYLSRDFKLPQRSDGKRIQWYDAMLGKPPTVETHDRAAYSYSVGPWRVAELAWPNFGGRRMPVHESWLGALTGETAVWATSLYMGLLPVALALCAWRLRGAEVRTAWLSWIALIGLVGSFGAYGLGWLLRVIDGRPPFGDPVGGLYWLFTVVLPSFVQFRYPAKLMTLAALGISGLAAIGWRQMMASDVRPVLRWLSIAMLASVAGLVVLAAVTPWWDVWLAGSRHRHFGPLQTDAAWWGLVRSLLHTLLLAAAVRWLIRRWGNSAADKAPKRNNVPAMPTVQAVVWIAPGLLLLTALDLAVAQRSLILIAPDAEWEAEPAIARLYAEADRRRDPDSADTEQSRPSPPRTYRLFGLYDALAADDETTSSEDRVVDMLRRERALMQPHYSLPERHAAVGIGGTIDLIDYQRLISPMIQPDPLTYVHPRRALDAWGVRYFVAPRRSEPGNILRAGGALDNQWLEPRWRPDRTQDVPEGPPLAPAVEQPERFLGPLSEHVKVLYNDSHSQRAWLVRHVIVTEPIHGADRGRLMPMVEAMLFPYQRWLDLRTMAWVEDENVLSIAPGGELKLPPSDDADVCRIVVDEPQRVEIEVELSSPALVVLADMHYPGWRLTLRTGRQSQELPILRANRAMRGALVPAGQHRLIYEYRPWSFYSGAAISIASWLAAACAIALSMRGRKGAVADKKVAK